MSAMGSNVAFRAKIGSLILGAVVLGLGLYSHYTSAWVETFYLEGSSSLLQLYKVCPILKSGSVTGYYTLFCPDIAMERYFVGAIIACFALSIIFFGLDLVKNDKSETIMYCDVGYHVLGGLALLAAGIVYLVSAIQIYYDFDYDNKFDDDDVHKKALHFRYLEKLIAASLTIIQRALMLTIARLIVRNTARGATSGTRVVVVQPVVAQPNYVVDAAVSYPQQSVGYIVPPHPYQQNAPPYAAVPAPQYVYPQQTNYGVPPTATAQPVGANQGAQSYGFAYASGHQRFGNGR